LNQIQTLRTAIASILIVLCSLLPPHGATAAQKAFFLFQSPSSETVPGNFATNFTVTLTYSNASGTINNAVFTNGITVTPSGQGVTASMNAISPTVADNGGTATLPLTISATGSGPANTTYQIVVSATNNAFTANVPAGIAFVTNTFIVGPPGNSNSFSMALAPVASSVPVGTMTNISSTLTLVDYSSTISGIVTNAVSLSGPDTVNVTASLDNSLAPVTNNFGQTNLTLTISVNSNALAGVYTITVTGTNGAFTANPTPGTASAAFTLTLFTPASFGVGIAPTTETAAGGVAGIVTATVTFTNLTGNLTEPLTNSVIVTGPDATNLTAGLNSNFATPPPGGTAALTLAITNDGFALPGAYQIIVAATNNDFTANAPIPGVALVTNVFVINPIAPPSIGQFIVSGRSLQISGGGGLPGKPYVVFSSTNVMIPLAQWTPLVTNVFDGSGNFAANLNLPTNASSPQQFFAVALNLQATNLLSPVATPVFTPVAGPYLTQPAVAITSATSGATIRYTTDGSTPTELNGTIYTGPVTMPIAVDTNLTGFLTNCSGVTMLKAVAYKSGMADSPVFTGDYEVLIPMKYPPSASPVMGIAHVAYHVTSASWADTLSFWTNYFGFGAVAVSNNFALIKINDQQYVELYESPLDATQFQLVNWGFQVSDAEAYREQLATAGISVPPAVSTNALGNISFLTTDPDGHTNEWVQYLTNSITGLSQGQDMPGTEIFGYINGIGNCTTNESAADNYYINQCGFVTNQTHDVYIPNVNGYVELLTASPGQVTAALAGKHEKIQLLNFQGTLLSQSVNLLTNRNPAIPITLSVEGSVGTKQQNAADVYDDDGSRVRMIDE
jgi:hypothetical protein